MEALTRVESIKNRMRSLAARLATLGERAISYETLSGPRTKSANLLRAELLNRIENIPTYARDMDKLDEISGVLYSIEESIENGVGLSSYKSGAMIALGAAIIATAVFLS